MMGSKKLGISKTLENGLMTVTLTGELNTATAPKLNEAIAGDLANVNDIVFDMTDLAYITSAGLRILLYSYQEIEDRGNVTVRGANSVVREVIEITGFDEVIVLE